MRNVASFYLKFSATRYLVLGVDSLPFSHFFESTKCHRTRANHDFKLYEYKNKSFIKYSFFVRVVNMWNNLLKDVVHAGLLTLFRNRLGIYMNIDQYCK